MTSPGPLRGVRARVAGPRLRRALDYFAVQSADRRDFELAARRIASDHALSAQLSDVVTHLQDGMGQLLSEREAFLPAAFDPQDAGEPVELRFFYPVAFAAVLPDTLAFHRARAIPDAASRAILGDLGRHLRIFETTFGHTGLHVQNWLSMHLRGVIYDFGRLQADLETLHAPPSGDRPPIPDGTVVAGVHIPDSGPLSPAQVETSLARIGPFFDRHFPEIPSLTVARCTSWLLDGQLPQLVPGTNIADFCSRWTPYGAPAEGDGAVRNFVFRRPYADPADLVGRTRLERAVLAHWASGAHLHQQAGWLRLPTVGEPSGASQY